MSTGYEMPSHDALITEQAAVQAEKFQGRLLAEYSSHIFPGQSWREPRGSAVVDFVRPIIGDTERATLYEVLAGLSKAKLGQPVHWVDMGGGRALPMRQLGADLGMRQKLRMTNVDLFSFGLNGIRPDEIEHLEDLAHGMTEPEAEPALITANVETVKLPEPADIITSVEAIQYLNNPLEAMANWYNQLSDNGIMIIATTHDWASWIRYDREPGGSEQDEIPMKHLLEELSRAGINYAVTDESDWESGVRPRVAPDRVRIMAIQKKPETSLRVTKSVTKVWVNPYNFKAVYYEAPVEGSVSTVEFVSADTSVKLGQISLANIS